MARSLLDYKEEFYSSAAPSENIWNKFEIPLTPPGSPCRDSVIEKDLGELEDDWGIQVSPEKRSIVADIWYRISLQSKLIQDCMWSGCESAPATQSICYKKDVFEGQSLTTSTDCVDPSAVFPFPLNKEHNYSMTPAPSDTEEEIDVVTVESVKKMLEVKAEDELPSPVVKGDLEAVADKLKHSPKQTAISPSPTIHHKKVRTGLVWERRPTSASLANSDSEDYDGKRSMHNVLERKRRNDLKFSFVQLRDQVPELYQQERAAKVLILTKATEHVLWLQREDRILLKQLALEGQREAALSEKIERLRLQMLG